MGNSEFGARLKKAREDAGKKQIEVCEAIGIPKVQTLSAYERGVNYPPIETLKKLAVFYNVSTDWLLFGSKEITQRKKTQREYFVQIVEGVDALELDVKTEGDTKDNLFSLPYSYISLSDINYPDICSFAKDWSSLRNLRNNKTLSEKYYKAILKECIDNLSETMGQDQFQF